MKFKLLAVAIPLLTSLCVLPVTGQGTSFTYQGVLNQNGAPVNGGNDLTFTLYNAASGGGTVGSSNVVNDLLVTNGLFTVTLDFGEAAFNGAARWLQIAVRPGAGTGAYEAIAPRQPITATPYAIHAAGASAVGITGTLPDARLSANVALRNGGNVFNGSQLVTNGALGIGTVNPAAALHVNPGTNTGLALVIGDDPGAGGHTAMSFGLSSRTNGHGTIQAIRASGSAYGDVILNPIAGNVGVGITTPTNRFQVAGKAQATEFVGGGTIPLGGIIMWAGSAVPSGWALCDGASGTPDLRGRFILGSGAGAGLTPRVNGQTGGAETKVLSWDEMPEHNHYSIVPTTGYNATYNDRGEVFAASNEAINSNVGNSTGYAGGSRPFDKMPPFYVLAFIMRVQ